MVNSEAVRTHYLPEKLEERFADHSPPESAIALQVGGIRIDFATDCRTLATRVREYFAAYSGSGPAQGVVHVKVLTGPAEIWEDDDPEFHVEGTRVLQRDFAARRLPRGGAHEPERAIALVAPGLDDSIHNLLRWFLPPILLRNGCFLLHGAGAIRDGKGYVFFGQSEAGKSTSVSLISEADPRATILGDDGVLIQMRGEIPFLLSAPLGCGYSRAAPPPLAAPIGGLYALRQSDRHGITPLPVSRGIAALLASAMNVNFAEEVEAKMELASRFAFSARGIHELSFRKDAGFWPLVLKH